MRKENDTIEITEDVRIPGTDVILEAGDKIEVLKDSININTLISFVSDSMDGYRGGEEFGNDVVRAIVNTKDGEFFKGFKEAVDKRTFSLLGKNPRN